MCFWPAMWIFMVASELSSTWQMSHTYLTASFFGEASTSFPPNPVGNPIIVSEDDCSFFWTSSMQTISSSDTSSVGTTRSEMTSASGVTSEVVKRLPRPLVSQSCASFSIFSSSFFGAGTDGELVAAGGCALELSVLSAPLDLYPFSGAALPSNLATFLLCLAPPMWAFMVASEFKVTLQMSHVKVTEFFLGFSFIANLEKPDVENPIAAKSMVSAAHESNELTWAGTSAGRAADIAVFTGISDG